jgi:MFS family permease
MDQTARSWLIYQLTGSTWQLGVISAIRGAPFLLFGIPAGVIADRYDRKTQLIVAQTVNAILNVILATLILTRHIQVWHVYVTGFLTGTVQTFQQPSRQTMISDLVGERHLLNAISLNSAALNLSRSLGPALCGVLIGAFGIDVSYYIQGGFYAFATLWTAQIRIPRIPTPTGYTRSSTDKSMLASAKAGLSYIISNRLILALMILGMAPILLGMPYTSLMPDFAVKVFHGDQGTQSLLLAIVGVGALVGALTIASLGSKQGSGKLMIAGAAAFGLSLVLFSRSPVLQMALVFVFLAGFSNISYTSQNQTVIQLITPPELRGRVLGVYLLNRGLMPVGSLIAGALASSFGSPWAVTIMGGMCCILAIGVAISTPSLWKLNLKPKSY